MVKDDFFVVAYRILAYLYSCMKAGGIPDMGMISPEKLNIPERYWNSIIGNLYRAGYITGIQSYTNLNGETIYTPHSMEITMTGIEYLQSNTMMEKAKSFLRELKEIIPGL